MARTSRLADPEFARSVAEAWVAGMTRKQLAELFHVHIDTITEWTHDQRVLIHATALNQERVTRIVRIIDQELENRLQPASIKKMDAETLIKLRRELADKVKRIEITGGAPHDAMADLLAKLDESPELAAQIAGIPAALGPGDGEME